MLAPAYLERNYNTFRCSAGVSPRTFHPVTAEGEKNKDNIITYIADVGCVKWTQREGSRRGPYTKSASSERWDLLQLLGVDIVPELNRPPCLERPVS